MSRSVYIISGPSGTGKSTIAHALSKQIPNCALIPGDFIQEMHLNGRKRSLKEYRLIWDNIFILTKNFLTYGIDVIIDYKTLPDEAMWLKEKVSPLHVSVVYVILFATDYEQVEECNITDEISKKQSHKYTSYLQTVDVLNESNIESIIYNIRHNSKYCL
ncbi:AAA family ATPase [Salirhabdus salicampi]|uniref:AAA family ATPase n=1 Tax=Salirhabdus salicampi TaxID=476102 RepID=UPI0020C36111|nr:AAA family ATPase [Salirhabdus salicampi]MCP8615971.1 hypothetical protein [Salirhabdus salicampi]